MESTNSTYKQRELLYELRKDNLITEEEFQEKLKTINEKENEENKEREERELDKLVNWSIQPLVDKLEASVKAGLISQEDFELKKNQLYTDKMKETIDSLHIPKNNSKENKDIYIFVGVFLIVIIMIGIIVGTGATNSQPTKSQSTQNNTVKTDNDRSFVLNQDSYVFTYNKRQLLILNGTEVANQKTESATGRIEFSKNEIKLFTGNEYERFYIEKVTKAPGPDLLGSTLIDVHNNINEQYKVTVTKHDGGADIVSFHAVKMEVMMLFYINNGFTLDLKIYE